MPWAVFLAEAHLWQSHRAAERLHLLRVQAMVHSEQSMNLQQEDSRASQALRVR